MSVDMQYIKELNRIPDRAVLEQYTAATQWQHFTQPMKDVVLRTGLFVPETAMEIAFWRPPLACLEFVYTLSDEVAISLQNTSGKWDNNLISGGNLCLVYNTRLHGITAVNASAVIKDMHLYIPPQKLAQLLGTGSAHLVQTIVDNANRGSAHWPSVMTDTDPQIALILHQIFSRDSRSSADTLFLQGKILELLAREVEMLCGPSPGKISFQAEDIQKLQKARTILMHQMAAPPTIASLARKVGINERKMKQGFKELFGTTLYGFLRDYRMVQARLMFEQEHKSVTDVAFAVGYSNVSHFGVVFRQYYGVRPGEYLRALKKRADYMP